MTFFDRVVTNNPHYKELHTQNEDDLKVISGEDREYSDLVCRNCRRRTVVIDTRQIRSADEGMTTLASCTSCGQIERV